MNAVPLVAAFAPCGVESHLNAAVLAQCFYLSDKFISFHEWHYRTNTSDMQEIARDRHSPTHAAVYFEEYEICCRARDYVKMQWLMLQQAKHDDFVIATGVRYSVREFVDAAAKELGMPIPWEGEGVDEKGYTADGRCIAVVEPSGVEAAVLLVTAMMPLALRWKG